MNLRRLILLAGRIKAEGAFSNRDRKKSKINWAKTKRQRKDIY